MVNSITVLKIADKHFQNHRKAAITWILRNIKNIIRYCLQNLAEVNLTHFVWIFLMKLCNPYILNRQY